MLQNTERSEGGVPTLKKTSEEMATIKERKCLLGQMIKSIRTDDSRGYIPMRRLADAIRIPVSNLKYIEDGVNAPSPEVYNALLENLPVTNAELKELDLMYSAIRGTPPPDVCRIICTNHELNDALRLIGDTLLSREQIAEISALISSYKSTNTEGAAING